MSRLHVEESAVINASAQAVYAVFSDYRVGHNAILPKPYFTDMIVVEGGKGAGTIIDVHMEVFGSKAFYHQIVSEPEPGRVLVETDQEQGVVTTFTVDPVEGGSKALVTIATEMPTKRGVAGLVEKLINPPVMRWIYRKELRNLEAYLATTPQAEGALS
jgi:hypothetical protein